MYPEVTHLIFLIPFFVIYFVFRLKMMRRKYLKVFSEKNYLFLTQSVSPQRRRIKFIFELAVMALVVFALARPQFGESIQKITSEGLEIVLIMDVSPSMLAEDVKPSRLEIAKLHAKKLLENLGGDKVAIVALSGSSMLISPLTPDRGVLESYIDSLTVEAVSTRGTDFGKAFKAAAEAFGVSDDSKEEIKDSGATRVALLISDGENHEEGLDQGLEFLKSIGVRVFTVTEGTEKGGPIPERDSTGYLRGYKKDHSGQVIMSTARPENMASIARKGQGSAFYGTPDGSFIKNLLEDLSKLERGEFDSELKKTYDERFQIPLMIAVIIAIIELAIGLRRKGKQIWKGRFVPSP